MLMRIRWQQVLRAALALVAIGFAVVVFFAIRERQPASSPGGAARTDPAAIAESTRGESIMARGTRQEFKVEYARLLSYADGTLRFEGVKVVIPEREGTDFFLSGERATVTNAQSDIALEGNVRLVTSDGLTASSASATYQNADGILRIPGPLEFQKDRLHGRGVGATYDRPRDVLWLLKDAHVTVAPDPATGGSDLNVQSETASLARRDRYVRFEGAVEMEREATRMAGDLAIASLAPVEDRVELLELRGNARVRAAKAVPGGVEAMSARDMNLVYGPDGRLLERATLAGQAEAQITGPAGDAPRQLSADWIDAVLSGGAALTSLTARDNVNLAIPGEGETALDRRIRARTLEGHGEPGRGLTAVRFEERVEFHETRPSRGGAPALERIARAHRLDVTMQPGLGTLERAAFEGDVTFRDGATEASAPAAVYDLAGSRLQLSAAAAPARVTDAHVDVTARAIDLALERQTMVAEGDVRSLLKATTQAGGVDGSRQRPRMLRDDQPVNVTGHALTYEGAAGTAVYSGDARLWQGETAIQAATITLDDRQGNLTARGGVRSTWRLADTDPATGRTERKTTIATAQDLVYEEAERRATYTTDARLNGPEGDLRAARIELYLTPAGDALERLEAYDAVTLRSGVRTSHGDRLTYFAVDARYVMHGTPVRVWEQQPSDCRETSGRTLTFWRATSTILVDGNEQRTETTSGGTCPTAVPFL
jgi:LPS export ABC transporter protein LptC